MGNVPRTPAGKETPTDASGPANPATPGPPGPPAAGAPAAEPDARFTFANERTFLAWIRTALALVAAGLAIVQLLPPFHGIRWGRHAIGIPLILLGAVVAIVSYIEWDANQRAMRRGDPLRHSRLPRLLAVDRRAGRAGRGRAGADFRLSGAMSRAGRDAADDPGLARARTRLAWTRTALSFAAIGGVLLKRDLIAGFVILALSALVWGVGRLAGVPGRVSARPAPPAGHRSRGHRGIGRGPGHGPVRPADARPALLSHSPRPACPAPAHPRYL